MVIPSGNEAYAPVAFPSIVRNAICRGMIGRVVNDAPFIRMESLMKRILALAVVAVSLYSMGSAMAESRLGETNAPLQQHQAPSPQVTRQHQPIWNGHNLQPTQHELAKPDVSDTDGKVVDRLYRELIQEERGTYPDLFRDPTSKPAAEPPTSSK
jgi:hypothetical protein